MLVMLVLVKILDCIKSFYRDLHKIRIRDILFGVDVKQAYIRVIYLTDLLADYLESTFIIEL